MCDANDINGCMGAKVIALRNRRDKIVGWCCSEECCNELAGELSEGTWCPFPQAKNALTPEQIAENLTYMREE